MSEDVLRRIYRLLETRIGHNVNALHKDVGIRALSDRIAATGSKSPNAYYELLLTSPTELQEFIELIVVPETWFFRDRVALDFVVNDCKDKWIRHHQSVRILCAPCSTGEEAYSLAMIFHEKNIPSKYYMIEGVDISKKALIHANLGVYGKYSFRAKEHTFRDTYFMEVDHGYKINSQIHQQVQLTYGNLCDPEFYIDKPIYNVIICRNLLIYLHPFAQRLLIQNFRKILHKQGVLVVSPSESEIVRKEGFIPYEDRKYSAFMRPDAQKEKEHQLLMEQKIRELESLKGIENQSLKNFPQENNHGKILADAQKMADQGEFTLALEACFKYLEKAGPQTETFFLIGVIQQAMGNDKEAEKYFQKVVELDPKHAKALVYLSLLADTRGDKAAAALFLKRAKDI